MGFLQMVTASREKRNNRLIHAKASYGLFTHNCLSLLHRRLFFCSHGNFAAMLGRTCLVKHVTRHPLQFAPARPIPRPNFPRQSRFYATEVHKKPNPLWLVGLVVVGFIGEFLFTKTRRGIGSLYSQATWTEFLIE